jgi:serine/threonine-protein kinase/endoribonuclease IRE1
MVISDFGLGKNLPENVSTLIDPTGNAGTSGWKAPELISQPRETESRHSQGNSMNGSESATNGTASGVKRAADIFSLGCLFFWLLTDGIHPYEDDNGWTQLRELNIKRDHKRLEVLERWSDAYEPMQLITSMLAHQPEHRPTALQVLNHPFFWSAEKRLAFLCDVSDHFEREPRGTYEDYYAGDSQHLAWLEEYAEVVIGPQHNFLVKLDRAFVDTLGKQRKYSGDRLLDLLRALRNKKNHYEDMSDEVKRRVGPLAGGYLNYWTSRFPRLLMACYDAIHDCRIEGNDRFKGYFESST